MTTWEETGPEILICHHYAEHASHERSSVPAKVAAFDLDSTLIKSKSGIWKTENPEDWTWWHPVVPDKLRQAFNDGFRIVIVTNQGRLTLKDGSTSPVQIFFKAKIELLLRALDIPITLYAACANDHWRKPRTEAWEHYVRRLSQETSFDEENSFLVGDAAGRVGDHDDVDRHFCENVGLKFFTPEQWFLDAAEELYTDRFDPKEYPKCHSKPHHVGIELKRNESPALYLLVGPPGAGKTTYYFTTLEPLLYERLDLVSSGSTEDVTCSIRARLSCNRSVVLDQRHLDRASRRKWVSFARECSISIFAIHFTTTLDLCLHNDAVRALGSTDIDPKHRRVCPRNDFWDLVGTFQEPTVEEGFLDVVKVDFEWRGTEEARNVWQKFWI
ncbi:polynucleotide kinase 3 phosphatase-domain-containing protein [Lophiotrema nucula]|uniref:Polynucleotide kinase 3 phosphatase-domain-containing protein n=1 Tax=Lophiotrema nucula TaxID=690887 RepID=A0A6A5Z0V8_9PLEO|nr:polynucleotide kinase 3 phosphatase-domain-containing protein [Lophiotrema nucula]